MRNAHCRTWNMAINVGNGKKKKRETHKVGPGIWRETLKMWKMRNTPCRILNMARNRKTWKRRHTHTHCRTWNMARKMTNEENEKITW